MCHSINEPGEASPSTSTICGSRGCDAQSKAATAGRHGSSSWPFDPDIVPPLQWWRTMLANQLSDAQHLLLGLAIARTVVLRERKRPAGSHGDAAARIGFALGALPITDLTPEIDLAMSALMASALGGNITAAQVMAYILRLTPLDHPFANELSVSWLAVDLQRALKKRRLRSATPSKNGNRYPATHDVTSRAGDFR